jgi:hypothetical protein
MRNGTEHRQTNRNALDDFRREMRGGFGDFEVSAYAAARVRRRRAGAAVRMSESKSDELGRSE